MSSYNIRLTVLFLATILFLSCGKRVKNDSVQSAEKQDGDMASVNNDSEVKEDYDFAVEAADGNLLEVQAGQLALAKASSAEIKRLGQTMITDHSKSNDELRRITHAKNVVLPTGLSDKSKNKLDGLSNRQGAEFDKAYSSMTVNSHASAMTAFKKEADTGKDPDLRSFAATKMPQMEHHIEMSRAAEKSTN